MMGTAAKVLVILPNGSQFEAETMDVPPHLQAKVFGQDKNPAKILVIGSLHPCQFLQPQALCA
jgi:hypothetical protein